MKITNNETGQQYQLNPGTELEIERTNPFFNEYGEQSSPLDLPDTDLNRKLTGHPHLLGNKAKASQRILATIEDGDYSMQCRQAILSAKKKQAINTSFYMNEGAFYDTIPDTLLTTIFANETVPGITTVAQGIAFCTSLLSTNDERFAIFPVLIDGESDVKKQINRIARMDSSGNLIIQRDFVSSWISPKFYNSFERTEIINSENITFAPGFYISPFIKANYLLKRIFQYFGYTLEENFFTQTEPFTKMVFLNKTADTLVDGVIKFSDVVPHCTCSTILNIFRKKFDCEFIPDELTKTVKIELFKNLKNKLPFIDLSKSLIGDPNIDYPETYKQIKITSESTITDSSSTVDSFDSISDLLKTYPTAVFEKSDQCFYRTGFTIGVTTIQKVASSAIPYQDLEKNEISDVTVPDCQSIMIPSPTDMMSEHSVGSGRQVTDYVPTLYVGAGNFLNSTIKYATAPDNEDSESVVTASTEDEKPMLAFYYDATGSSYIHGTISNYNYLGTLKLWDYSLCYFGSEGIFEKFYGYRDALLRNSLHSITANLLLTNTLKRTIPAFEPIELSGHRLLINSLKYKIGGSNDPQESEFFTTQLYEPIDQAPSQALLNDKPTYKWQVNKTYVEITDSEYNASIYKDKSYTAFYPPHPTELGGHFYDQRIARFGRPCYLYTYYLSGVLNT